MDLTTDSSVGSWAEATYKVAGVYKASNDVATIVMTSGEKVTIRRTDRTAELRGTDGVTYPISDECTGSCSDDGSRRRLGTNAGPVSSIQFTGPRMTRATKESTDNHRKLGFFSALMTTGSFTMMQAGSF